jgi:acetoin utilization protein AcuB
MLVRDIMSTNVITIPSNMPVPEARKVMDFHKIARLPVVDKGELVGLVAKDDLLRATPSEATSLSVWELNYLLAKLAVKEIMKKDVVTTTPDATPEQAVGLAQSKKVGCLPVLEDGKIVGIVTTNDFFYKLLNPLLGIGETGTRIIIFGAGQPEDIRKVMGCVSEAGMKLKAISAVVSTGGGGKDLVLHLDTADASQVMASIKSLGFSVGKVAS